MPRLADVADKLANRAQRRAARLAAWKRPRTKAARDKQRADRILAARERMGKR